MTFRLEHQSIYRAGNKVRKSWHPIETFETRNEAEEIAAKLKASQMLVTRIVED